MLYRIVNGHWQIGEGKEWTAHNPADGSVLACYPFASGEQVHLAARRANEAFASGRWSKISRGERAAILRAIADLIRSNVEKLAALETLAKGKLYKEVLVDDIPTCADIFDYYAGWVDKYYGVTSPIDAGFLNYTLVQPVGVCGLIAPWNFPLYQASLKIAPALAMGNTAILKPSNSTPFSAIFLQELIDQHLDVPQGVLNLLVTDGATVDILAASHDVHKVLNLTVTRPSSPGRIRRVLVAAVQP